MQILSRHYVLAFLAPGLILNSIITFGMTVGHEAPDFSLQDSKGKTHMLSEYKGKFVVLEWTNYECPFVLKHYESGNMQKLQKKYSEKGVVWLSICSSAKEKQGNFSPTGVNERMTKFKAFCTAYLMDEDGKIGRQYGAKTTPHIFIVGTDGTLIYQGAIDSIPSYKKKDITDADNYVALTLDAAFEGKKVEPHTTKPYGCSVKYGD